MDAQVSTAELLRMALAASARNDSESSIGLLERVIAQDDRLAEAHYLLGAEYAGRGLYDQAIQRMRAALERKPELAAARFQLGLLQLTMARVEDATSTWGFLDLLPANHPLLLFKTGLLHLVRDEFESAAAALRAGMARNTENAPLNRDMQLVLERVAAAQSRGAAAEASGQHFLVSAYRSH
jgi:tetratricopeptide (TPR) repeat protein